MKKRQRKKVRKKLLKEMVGQVRVYVQKLIERGRRENAEIDECIDDYLAKRDDPIKKLSE